MNLAGMSEKNVSVGLIQMSCEAGKEANLEKAVVRIREAASKGAQIICLQELFLSKYFCWEENYDYFNTRPRLNTDDNGNITVLGGARRVKPNDTPVVKPPNEVPAAPAKP